MTTRGLPSAVQQSSMEPWAVYVGVVSEQPYQGQIMVALHTEILQGTYDVYVSSILFANDFQLN